MLLSLEGNQLVNLHFFFHIGRKKLPNSGSNNSLMVGGSEPGRKDHVFNPRLGNFYQDQIIA